MRGTQSYLRSWTFCVCAFAYQTAKERLERKYGGTRREVMGYLDALENFKPIRQDHPKDADKFEDLLDVAVTI